MSKRKISGKVLIVRLGRDETQIVLMGANSEIIHSAVINTPQGAVEDGMIRNTDAVRDMLKSALKTPELKHARRAIFALCTSQVITETVAVPDLAPKKLEKLIKTNMDMYFPVDMKDYRLVWQAIGPKPDSDELMVQLWAVPIAMLSRYYSVANACGLSLEAVDYCGNSIATAVGASFAQPAKAAKGKKTAEQKKSPSAARNICHTDLHILLEKDLLGMTFVQEGQVVMQRFIQCGSDPSYQFGELAMMVEYFRSLDVGRGSPIQGLLAGSLAANKELAAELEDMLGISLSLFSAPYDPKLCMCVGAAYSTLEFGIPTLNKPGKARRELQSQIWQYALLLAGGLAAVFVVLLMLNSRLSWSSEISSLESTRQTLSIQAQKTNEYATNYNNYVAKYNAYSSDWETIFDNLRTYNDNLVLVMEELEDILPENCSVTELQIGEQAIAVRFACENKEEAAYLIMELRELQYADLVAITDLEGGGKGPATSFGSEETEEEGEAAPTEGSYELTDDQINTIVKLFAGSVDGSAIMEVALTLSPEQIEQIEDTYGSQPSTTYSRLDALKTDKGDRNDFLLRRANAVNDMLSTNYFAMYHFFNLLGEDIYRDDPLLWDEIEEEMMSPENADIWSAIASGTVSDANTLQDYTERVIAMLIKDEATIQATEDLLCESEKMEKWYIYYLEVELGMNESKSYPYLNVQKVLEDLMEGSFNTGDKNADKKLNSLVPDAAWKMLELLKQDPDEEPDEEPDDEPQVKPLPNNMSEDEAIAVYKDFIAGTSNVAKQEVAKQLLERYNNNDLVGYDKLKKVIKDHLNSDDDDGYVYKTYTEEDLLEMFELFLKYQDAGSTQKTTDAVSILYTWLTNNGKTGITELDQLVRAWVSTLNEEEQQALIAALMGKSASGSSGGSGSGVTDTRVHFTAALAYNEELKNAELERKGLSRDDKLEDQIAGMLENGEGSN